MRKTVRDEERKIEIIKQTVRKTVTRTMKKQPMPQKKRVSLYRKDEKKEMKKVTEEIN